jgi:kynurenine 3-monooxygenase
MKPGAITIVGAGLAGPLLAISLVQRGFSVTLYERRPDMRRVRISAGRSINLALSTRGIYALQQAGVWEGLQNIVIPMRGRMMHSVTGELTFQPYGKDDSEYINSVSRGELNIALLNAAEACGVTIHFNHRCIGYHREEGGVRLQMRDAEAGFDSTVEAECVIGADGAGSAIREAMVRAGRYNFSQEYLDYGYKELTIPAGPDGRHVLETHALHIWPRGAYMLIALPNIDGSFGCILFLPFEGQGEASFDQLDSEAEVVAFFRSHFPDALALMPQLAENYFANPTGAMVTIKCFPWHEGGKVLLLGDAAHAIVPFFGQGINCGFEDCTCFLEFLDGARNNGGAARDFDWAHVFSEFDRSRKSNTDAIADLALENFIEMRDRVADPHFLFKKKVELALQAKYPGVFVPKYAMVTFHRIPYSVALQRGQIQDDMLEQLCAHVERLEDLDWPKAGALIHEHLTPLSTS